MVPLGLRTKKNIVNFPSSDLVWLNQINKRAKNGLVLSVLSRLGVEAGSVWRGWRDLEEEGKICNYTHGGIRWLGWLG